MQKWHTEDLWDQSYWHNLSILLTFTSELPHYEHQIRGLGGVICRVKIDPLDLGKPHTKYIWGDSPLQMEFNEPIRAVKASIFNIWHVETWNVPVTKRSKMTVCVEANFSKTAERNKTPFTGIQVLLKLSSNQKSDQKLVHSTRRYSNIKVPYQMTKMTHFVSGFSTITNNHSL